MGFKRQSHFHNSDLKEIAMVGELPPAGAVNPSIKRR